MNKKKAVVCTIIIMVALALVLTCKFIFNSYNCLFELIELVTHCLVCHLIGENISKFFAWLFDK